jgi:ElaB/YqjD/DUF883 family membrane-anchored ribosome-binding protein
MTELARQADGGSGSQSMAKQAQQKVQEKAGEVRGQVSSRVRDQVDTRSTQAGEQLSSVADAMRRTGQSLRDEGSDAPAKVTDAVAERADRLGGYLRNSDADAILRDVEDLARRQPWLFAAGGLVLGLLASRFLKASSGGRYRAQNGGTSRGDVSPAESEPQIVFEPGVELDSPTRVGHGA